MKAIARTIVAAAVVSVSWAGAAKAAYFYFAKRPVKTESEATCFSFARDVARRNLTNVHSTPGLEVAGSKGGAYASITCVGGGSGRSATAVVMVVGDNQQEVMGLRDRLGNAIAGIQMID